MKAAAHISELRQMEIGDLDARLKEVRTELFNLRFQAATGQLENHRQIRAVRRQIAQVLTVIQGRRLGLEERVLQASDAAVAPKAQARIEHGQDVGGVPTAVAEPQAAAEAAVAEEAVAPEAVAPEGIADEAVADEAVADEAVGDEAVGDEAVADEAVAEEPVAEAPAVPLADLVGTKQEDTAEVTEEGSK
jgi:large subunit ribosomal protein L29